MRWWERGALGMGLRSKAVTRVAEGCHQNGHGLAGEQAPARQEKPSPDCIHIQPPKLLFDFWLWWHCYDYLMSSYFYQKKLLVREEKDPKKEKKTYFKH